MRRINKCLLFLACLSMILFFLSSCEKENPYQELIEEPKNDEVKEEKPETKVEITLGGHASFTGLEFTDSVAVKRTISPNVLSMSLFSAVCVIRDMQGDTVIYQPVVFEKQNENFVLKEHKLVLNSNKTTDNKTWKAKYIAGGEWNDELKKWTLSPKFSVLASNSTDVLSLDLPLSTDWIDLTVAEVGKSRSEGTETNATIMFQPQGVVLAQRLYTNNVSETVNLSQLKFQTNSISFDSFCDFANKSNLDTSAQGELIFENNSNKTSNENNGNTQEYTIKFDIPISLSPKSDNSRQQYLYICGITHATPDRDKPFIRTYADGMFNGENEEKFANLQILNLTLSKVASGEVLSLSSSVNISKPKEKEPAAEPQPKPDVPVVEYKKEDWAGKTMFVHGLKNLPNPNDWRYTDPYKSQGLKWDKSYGWYDANKDNPEIGGYDCNLCWAATVANTLNWWFDQNKDYLERYGYDGPKNYTDSFNSEIFKYFKKSFPNDGGDILGGFKWFLNSYYGHQKMNGGGFFKDVFDEKPIGRKINARADDFVLEVYKALINKESISCAIQFPNAFLHGISIWGVEFDNQGGVSALYITDSNDRDIEDQKEYSNFLKRGNTKAGLLKKRVQKKNGYYYIESSVPGKYTFQIAELYFIGSYKEKWEEYFNKVGK